MLERPVGFTAFYVLFAHRFRGWSRGGGWARTCAGLLGEVERMNGWTLAEAAGDAGPEGMQRLLNFYSRGLRQDPRRA